MEYTIFEIQEIIDKNRLEKEGITPQKAYDRKNWLPIFKKEYENEVNELKRHHSEWYSV